MAKKHFSMTAKQLCATGDKACKAELKRRGRDSSGKKIGSKAKSVKRKAKKYPVWTLTPEGKLGYETGVTYTKKVVARDEPKGPEFVGTALAEPRKGFGRWPFDIYKVGGGPGEAGFFIDGVDFPENRGPHPTLKATFEAIQADAFATGT